MEHREGTLSGSLELASAFSSQINTGVPVELVEAENQGPAGLSGENGAQNVSGEEAMEISVEGDPNGSQEHSTGPLDSTRLSSAQGSGAVQLPPAVASSLSASSSSAAATSGGVDGAMGGLALPGMSSGAANGEGRPSSTASVGQLGTADNPVSSTTTSAQGLLSSTNFPPQGLSASSQQSMLSAAAADADNPHSTQLAHSVMEQLSEAQGLEISADAITSMSLPDNSGQGNDSSGGGGGGGYALPQISSYSSTPSVSSLMAASRGHRDLLTGNVSYGDLDLSVGANTSAIDTSNVGGDPDSPSSVESNFDSSELLSNPLSQQDEVTQRLAQSGPVGIAAAAAIMSGSRKRKRQHTFETNPSFRKRHCSKLTKKLKETIDELAVRVGLQAVVLTYRPGKGNGKNDPSFKVFGAAPLVNIVRNQREAIVSDMEAALHQQAPPTVAPPTTQQESLFELPTLVFDGIPTPVHKMTQAQLRTFIPNMLKYSTGRGKPGWGKEDVRPPWWPDDVPWANVRSDIRTAEQKKALQWTDALRRIVINCYLHHGRMDLLPEFSLDLLQQYLTPQVAEQIQAQLDSLQQQQQQQQQQEDPAPSSEVPIPTVSADSAAEEVAAALNEITEASGGVEGRDDPEMMVGDNQQVFTVDTGIGNCDMAGMPTLADASLAETAARLQQLADETGEVQYATQTVTVTDRDAKALGQPVGSTTTVLLTAYPGGHSGGGGTTAGGGSGGAGGSGGGGMTGAGVGGVSVPGGGGAAAGSGGVDQQEGVAGGAEATGVAASQQFLATQPNTASNVQVVYSASHIDPIPGTISSDVTNTSLTTSHLADFTSAPSSSHHGEAEVRGQAGGASGGGGVSDYLNPTPGLPAHSNANVVGGASDAADAANDLAAELIREYSLGATSGGGGAGGEGLDGKSTHLTPMSGASTAGKDTKTVES